MVHLSPAWCINNYHVHLLIIHNTLTYWYSGIFLHNAIKWLSKHTEIVNNLQIFFIICFIYLTYGKHNKSLSDYCVLKHGFNVQCSSLLHKFMALLIS